MSLGGEGCAARPYPLHFCSSVEKRWPADVPKHNDVEDVDQGFQDWVEVASTTDPPDDCFDWEQGHVDPQFTRGQTPCLVTELGPDQDTVLHLRSLALSRLPVDLSGQRTRFLAVPHSHFVHHLSLLLMGVESSSFPRLPFDTGLGLCPTVTLANVSPEVVASLVQPFVEAGNAVRQIHLRAKSQHNDIGSAIYKGFVRGVNNWLMIHSVCVARLASSVPGAFEFTEAAQPLLLQAQFVGRLCGIHATPPATTQDIRTMAAGKRRSEQPRHFEVPTGMSLIRHILEVTRSVGQQDLHLITVSILNAALKPYFKFLSKWLFEGKHSSSDAEFGLDVHSAHLQAESALYWTHCFVDNLGGSGVHDEASALDLETLTRTVVSCGKSVNLLRCCRRRDESEGGVDSGLGEEVSPPPLKLAISPAQEQDLRQSFEEYKDQIVKAQEEAEEKRLLLKSQEEKQQKERAVLDSCSEPEEKSEAVPEPPSISPPPQVAAAAAGAKKDVTGKIGHDDEAQDEVLKANEEEEKKRIAAVKRDLRLFYGHLTTDHDESEVKSLQDPTEGTEGQTEESSSEPKGTEDSTNESSKLADKQTGEQSTDAPKSEPSKTEPQKFELPAAGLKTSHETAGRIPRMGRRFASKSERNTPVREHAGEFKPVVRKKSADDLVRATHPLFKVPDPVPPPGRKKRPELPSVDQFVTIGDAVTTPYAFPAFTAVAAAAVTEPSSGEGQNRNTTDENSFLPLDLMLKRSIQVPLQVQFRTVSQQLLRYFYDSRPVSLWTYLTAVRRYLLLQDSEFAHGLCVGLIGRESGNSYHPFISPSSATQMLQDAIAGSVQASHDPVASQNLGFVMLDPSSSDIADKNDISKLKSDSFLTLSLNVSWPFNIVLTDDIMRGYQRIFRLMLHLERAYTSLQQAFMFLRRQRKLSNDPRYKDIQFIRHGMLNYLLTIRGYLRSQILDKCWVKFQEDVSRYVVCLDTLRTVHSFYVDKCLTKSFMKKELAPIRETVYKTVGSINKFSRAVAANPEAFQQDVLPDAIHAQALKEARNFNACLAFFISVVSKLEGRGYKHHMQELLVCLKNSTMRI